MAHQAVLRAPVAVRLLTRLGMDRGVPAATCLRGTGLRPEDLDRPDQYVTAEQEFAVISNLQDALGDPPGLGLEAGVRHHVTTLGMLGLAVISSPTLRAAIEFTMQHRELSLTQYRVTKRDEGGLFYLLLDPSTVPVRLRRFVIERDIAAAAHMAQSEVLGGYGLRRVMFAFPPPPDEVLHRYEEVLGLRPEFDAPEHGLALDSALLDRPLPQADAYAVHLAEEHCRRQVEKRRPRAGLAGQVRRVVLGRTQAPPSLDEVASMLDLSPRTLRRRLADEGVSYRSLLDEVRAEIAQELLNGRLTVEEVAQRLGYAETSSFTHAFRRWTGQGPRAHRAAANVPDGLPKPETTPLSPGG